MRACRRQALVWHGIFWRSANYVVERYYQALRFSCCLRRALADALGKILPKEFVAGLAIMTI